MFDSDAESATAETLLAEARALADRRLEALAEQLRVEVGGREGEALGYALRTTGKRVRPALVLACYRASGGTSPAIGGLATAVEIVHTYSLVHDDLPCMDDDAQRRGRPTTHVAFDTPVATRVGYVLVPVAVEVVCEAMRALELSPERQARIAGVLLAAGGIRGMVGGQWLDLTAEGRRLDRNTLRQIHRRKTGALIEAGCLIGALAAGASETLLRAIAGFGRDIGLAFQIADDVLDATATTAQLGKTAGRDFTLAKSTYVSVLGVDGARREAARHARQAMEHLARSGLLSPSLGSLAGYIVSRRS